MGRRGNTQESCKENRGGEEIAIKKENVEKEEATHKGDRIWEPGPFIFHVYFIFSYPFLFLIPYLSLKNVILNPVLTLPSFFLFYFGNKIPVSRMNIMF